MVDSLFFNNFGPFSLAEVARIGQAKIFFQGKEDNCDTSTLVESVAPLEVATPSDVSVFHNKKYINSFKGSKAGACFAEKSFIDVAPPTMALLVSDNPYKSYALVATAFYPPEEFSEFISPACFIHESAVIGQGTYIDYGVYIGENVIIGNNCVIRANSYIGKGVIMGDNCRVASNVTITHSIIGSKVIIHPGARIGQDGFGFASDRNGHYKVPQLGRVIIGDNAEIGANTCIDRGAGHDTIIGDYCMIDNLVQIGHNVQLDNGCVIVAQVGISGSSKLGKFVQVGGQAGIAGHLTIGTGAKIAAQSGVGKDIPPMDVQGGYPAVPIKQWHRQTIKLKKITNKGD